MNTEQIKALIEEVKKIAIDAGEKIMEIYNDVDSFEVEQKNDDSPLTRADREANTIICDQLNKLAHQFPIISEENKLVPYSERKDYDYVWMVDPLDGTKEFIKRNGEFTVNIALIHNEASIAGVVYTPVTEELYHAVKGDGAYKVHKGEETPIHCASYHAQDEGLSIVCSRSHLNDATQTFIDEYNSPKKVSKGSSLKFLIIAEGEAHIYPRLAPTMEWDTAAAQIILEESGGIMHNVTDNQTVKYNKENLLNPHFVAYANKTS
jgi:3'(2'), 5'-bisphosphate nucleotidase